MDELAALGAPSPAKKDQDRDPKAVDFNKWLLDRVKADKANITITNLLTQDGKKWSKCTDVVLAFDALPDVHCMGQTFKLAFEAYQKIYSKVIHDFDFRNKDTFKSLSEQLSALNLHIGTKKLATKAPLAHVLAWLKVAAAMRSE